MYRLLLLAWFVGCTAQSSTPMAAGPVYDGQNRSLSFDGLNDYASTGTAAFPAARYEHSLVLWVRPLRVLAGPDAGNPDSGLGDLQSLLALRKDYESGMVVGIHDGFFEVWSVVDDVPFVTAAARARANVWQHLAYTYDGSTNRLFVDGVLVAQADGEPGHRTSTTGWLGSIDGSNQLFVGELDEVEVHKVALTAGAIAARAARRAAETNAEQDQDVVLSLGFDEVSGRKAFDRSAYGNDALLGDGVEAHVPRRVLAP